MTSFLFEYSSEELVFAFSGKSGEWEEQSLKKNLESFAKGDLAEAVVLKSARPREEPDLLLAEHPKVRQEIDALEEREFTGSEKSEIASVRSAAEAEEVILKKVHRPLAGSTTVDRLSASANSCCWANGVASDFKVRVGPNYSKLKKKSPSGDSMYNQIGMDLFRNRFDKETKISNVSQYVELPPANLPEFGQQGPCALPRIVICNIQIPLEAPKMFGKSNPEPGVSIVQYFEISHGTYREALNLETASPAVKMFAKFFNEAAFNDDLARRFKVVGMIKNMAEVGVPSMFQGYNGKPAIVFKTGTIFRGAIDGNPADQFLEMDINVHEFAYLPRKAIHSLLDRVSLMELQCAYVIQGEKDHELPERSFACSAMFNLDVSKAVDVCFPPEGSDEQVARSITIG